MINDWVIFTRNSGTSNIRRYAIDDSALVDPITINSGSGTQVVSASMRPQNDVFMVGQTSGATLRAIHFDDETGEFGDNDPVSIAPNVTCYPGDWSADGSLFVFCHDGGSGDYAGTRLTLFGYSDGAFSRLDSAPLDEPGVACSISPDGRWVAASDDLNNRRVSIFEVIGSSLVFRHQFQIASSESIIGFSWINNATFIDSAAGSAQIVAISESGIASNVQTIDAVQSGGSFGLSPDKAFGGHGGAGNVTRIFSITPDTASEVQELGANQTRNLRWTRSGNFVVGHSGSTAYLYSWDGQATLIDSDGWDSTINGCIVTRDEQQPPPTPEELFRATFAEASGNPAMETALINPQDVQRCINHQVRQYVGLPDEVVILVHDPDISQIEPGACKLFNVDGTVMKLRIRRRRRIAQSRWVILYCRN